MGHRVIYFDVYDNFTVASYIQYIEDNYLLKSYFMKYA